MFTWFSFSVGAQIKFKKSFQGKIWKILCTLFTFLSWSSPFQLNRDFCLLLNFSLWTGKRLYLSLGSSKMQSQRQRLPWWLRIGVRKGKTGIVKWVECPLKDVLPFGLCCGQHGLELAGDFLSCIECISELLAWGTEEKKVFSHNYLSPHWSKVAPLILPEIRRSEQLSRILHVWKFKEVPGQKVGSMQSGYTYPLMNTLDDMAKMGGAKGWAERNWAGKKRYLIQFVPWTCVLIQQVFLINPNSSNSLQSGGWL